MIYSTPPNIVRFAKIFTTGSAETEKNKKQKKKKFEKFKFLQERDVPKLCTFRSTLTLRFSLKMAKIEKNIFKEKL